MKNKLDMCDSDEIHVDFRSSDFVPDVKHTSDVTQSQLSITTVTCIIWHFLDF